MQVHESVFIPHISVGARLRTRTTKLYNQVEAAVLRGNTSVGSLFGDFIEDQLTRLDNKSGTPYDGIWMGTGMVDVRNLMYMAHSQARADVTKDAYGQLSNFLLDFQSRITAISTIPMTAVKLVVGMNVPVGSTVPLKYTYLPENATETTVTYESLTPDIATVSSTGLFTAIKPGECRVKVSDASSSLVFDTGVVTVLAAGTAAK